MIKREMELIDIGAAEGKQYQRIHNGISKSSPKKSFCTSRAEKKPCRAHDG